jgi:hypothetical protein
LASIPLIKDAMCSSPTPNIPRLPQCLASYESAARVLDSWWCTQLRKDGRGYSKRSAQDERAPSRSEGQAPAAVALQFRPGHIGGRADARSCCPRARSTMASLSGTPSEFINIRYFRFVKKIYLDKF